VLQKNRYFLLRLVFLPVFFRVLRFLPFFFAGMRPPFEFDSLEVTKPMLVTQAITVNETNQSYPSAAR
jgi:hypothetical protein